MTSAASSPLTDLQPNLSGRVVEISPSTYPSEFPVPTTVLALARRDGVVDAETASTCEGQVWVVPVPVICSDTDAVLLIGSAHCRQTHPA